MKASAVKESQEGEEGKGLRTPTDVEKHSYL